MRTLHAVELIDVAPARRTRRIPTRPRRPAPWTARAARCRSGVQAEPEEVRERLTENRAMEFFKRPTTSAPPARTGRVKQEKKRTLTGALALLDLLDNSKDPYADE